MSSPASAESASKRAATSPASVVSTRLVSTATASSARGAHSTLPRPGVASLPMTSTQPLLIASAVSVASAVLRRRDLSLYIQFILWIFIEKISARPGDRTVRAVAISGLVAPAPQPYGARQEREAQCNAHPERRRGKQGARGEHFAERRDHDLGGLAALDVDRHALPVALERQLEAAAEPMPEPFREMRSTQQRTLRDHHQDRRQQSPAEHGALRERRDQQQPTVQRDEPESLDQQQVGEHPRDVSQRTGAAGKRRARAGPQQGHAADQPDEDAGDQEHEDGQQRNRGDARQVLGSHGPEIRHRQGFPEQDAAVLTFRR